LEFGKKARAMDKLRPLIAGNWKMNGCRTDGLALARAVRAGVAGIRAEMLICPPATLLAPVGELLAGGPVALGGQDCHEAAAGAHTGDISAAMLADLGCRYVLVGHSERRAEHGESDGLVRAKAEAAMAAGLAAIVCLGETQTERDRGETLAVVARQLVGSLPAGALATNAVVAYEPVWAIGTGRTPVNADIAAAHGHLRRELAGRFAQGAKIRLLYGGSVKPGNAAEILALPDVNGALVGGASLNAEDFLAIARACR
jgi:triosephosphate isomerase (TIM)